MRIDGKSSGSLKEKNLDKFHYDPKVEVGLLSILACGTGLNLTKVYNHSMLYGTRTVPSCSVLHIYISRYSNTYCIVLLYIVIYTYKLYCLLTYYILQCTLRYCIMLNYTHIISCRVVIMPLILHLFFSHTRLICLSYSSYMPLIPHS